MLIVGIFQAPQFQDFWSWYSSSAHHKRLNNGYFSLEEKKSNEKCPSVYKNMDKIMIKNIFFKKIIHITIKERIKLRATGEGRRKERSG